MATTKSTGLDPIEALLASKQAIQERKQEVQKIVEQNKASGKSQTSAREPYRSNVSDTFIENRTGLTPAVRSYQETVDNTPTYAQSKKQDTASKILGLLPTSPLNQKTTAQDYASRDLNLLTDIASSLAQRKKAEDAWTNAFISNNANAMAEAQKNYARYGTSENRIRQMQSTARERLDQHQLADIARVTEKPDFAELSKYQSTATGKDNEFNIFSNTYEGAFGDELYDYINRNPQAVSSQRQKAQNNNAAFLGLDNSYVENMTDNEISIYNYLYATQGKASANRYIDLLKPDLTARRAQGENQRWTQYAQERPVLSSAFSVLTSPTKALSALGQVSEYGASGQLDANAGYNKFSNIPANIRGTVSAKVEENFGPVGSEIYNIGMSMGDSLMAMAAGGGNNAFTLAIMGMGATADTTIAAKNRGLSDQQAITLGIAAGAAEAAMEKLGLDTLFDKALMGKGAAAYFVKNVFTNAGEEGATSLANLLVDIIVARDKSEWQQSIKAYKEADPTLSDGQAWLKAFGDQALAIGKDMLAGAISGGIFAAPGTISSTWGNSTTQETTTSQTAESVAEAQAEQDAQVLIDAQNNAEEQAARAQDTKAVEEAAATIAEGNGKRYRGSTEQSQQEAQATPPQEVDAAVDAMAEVEQQQKGTRTKAQENAKALLETGKTADSGDIVITDASDFAAQEQLKQAKKEARAEERQRVAAQKQKQNAKNRVYKETERLTKLITKPKGMKGIHTGLLDATSAMIDLAQNVVPSEINGNKKFAGALRKSLSTVTTALDYLKNENTRDIYDEFGNKVEVDYEGLDQLDEIDEISAAAIEKLTGKLQSIADGVKGQKFTTQDAIDLAEALKGLRHQIRDANKLYAAQKNQTKSAVANGTFADLETAKQQTNISGKNIARKAINNPVAKLLTWDQADLETAETLMGSKHFKPLMQALYKGQDTATRKIRRGKEATANIFQKNNVTASDVQRWEKSLRTIELDSGRKVELSEAQLLDIYLLDKRPQGKQHLLGDGIRPGKPKKGKFTSSDTYKLTQADIDKMTSDRYLTKQQRDLADDLQNFVSGEVTSWYNEVWLRLFGRKMITEEHYWPISAAETVKFNEKTENYANLGGGSATRETKRGAQNAVTINSFLDVYSAHVQTSAYYYGMKPAFQDLKGVYNYKDKNTGKTVRAEIRDVRGEAAQRWMDEMLQHLGGAIGETAGAGEMSTALLNLYKSSAIVANMRVVVQQPTAVIRATAELGVSDMTKGIFKGNLKEMLEHSDLAWWKSEGNSDMQRSKSTRELITGMKTAKQKATDAGMWLAGKADDLGWAQIWGASKAYVERVHGNVEVGSEQYWQMVNDKFSDVINKTQVIDSPLHRSAAMRSKKGLAPMNTAFMSEPTKVYNMIQRAVIEYRDNPTKQNAGKLFRSASAVVASTAVNAFATALYDTLRGDDDKEKSKLKQLGENYWDDLVQGLNPLTYHWATSQLWDVFSGQYGATERMDLAAIDDIARAAKDIFELWENGYSDKTPYALITNLARPFAGGAIGTFEAIWNTFSPTNIQKKSPTATVTGAYQAVYDLARAGDMEGSLQLEAMLMEEGGKEEGENAFGFKVRTQTDMEGGLAECLYEDNKDTFKQIYELTLQGKAVEAQKLAKELESELISSNIVAKALEKYKGELADVLHEENKDTFKRMYDLISQGNVAEADKIAKRLESETITLNIISTALERYESSLSPDKRIPSTKDVSIFTNKDAAKAFLNGVESGNYDDFNAMRDDLIRISKAKDAQDAVEENIISELKSTYIQLYNERKETRLKYLGDAIKKEFGKTDDTLDGWIAGQIKASDGTALKTASQLEAFEKVGGEKSKNRDELIHVMSSLGSITGTPSGEKTEKGADKMIEGTQGLNQFKHIADSKLTLEEQLAVMESIGNQEGLYKRVKQAVDGGVDLDDYLNIETKLRLSKDNSDGYKYLADLDAKGDIDTMAAVMMSVSNLQGYSEDLYDEYISVAKTGRTAQEKEWVGDVYLNVRAVCSEGENTNSVKNIVAGLSPYLDDPKLTPEAFEAIVTAVGGDKSKFALKYEKAEPYCTVSQWAQIYSAYASNNNRKAPTVAKAKELGLSSSATTRIWKIISGN